MASRQIHNKDCRKALGRDFDEVHRWLDEFACVNGKLNINHRRFRHHCEALLEVEKLFGKEAVKAAIIHLQRDFGFIPTKSQVEEMCPEKPELIPFPWRVNKRDLRKYGQ